MTDDDNTKNTFDLSARSQMRPLRDPEVANAALEAFLDEEDVMEGGLAFLFCDRDGRLMQPVLVSDVPDPAGPEERWAAMRWATALCEMVGDEHAGPLALVLAIVRAGGPVCDADREWHQVAIEACAEADVPLIGVHVATLAGAVALPTAPGLADSAPDARPAGEPAA